MGGKARRIFSYWTRPPGRDLGRTDGLCDRRS